MFEDSRGRFIRIGIALALLLLANSCGPKALELEYIGKTTLQSKGPVSVLHATFEKLKRERPDAFGRVTCRIVGKPDEPGSVEISALRHTALDATASADRAADLLVEFLEEQERARSEMILEKLERESEIQRKKVEESRAKMLQLMRESGLD